MGLCPVFVTLSGNEKENLKKVEKGKVRLNLSNPNLNFQVRKKDKTFVIPT